MIKYVCGCGNIKYADGHSCAHCGRPEPKHGDMKFPPREPPSRHEKKPKRN